MKDTETTVKERKKQMKKSVELLDGIIADGAISDTHLRMLVDEIVISEKNGKLDIQITLRQARNPHSKKRGRIIRACLTENSARISTTTTKAEI